MAIDFKKYILSTGTHYISNSGKDERNQYRGGAAGDQSGHEWELKAWYSRPWTVVLRWPDIQVGLKIAQLGIAAALNNRIGYDQNQRTTYWTQLAKAGYDPSKITTPCEEDCTAGVTANCKAAGFLMGIQSLKNLPTSVYSGSMRSIFVKAGFKALTDSKYLSSPKYLLPGDVLLYESHHAATNITYGSKVRPAKAPVLGPIVGGSTAAEPVVEGLRRGDAGDEVRTMQRLLLKWDRECLPKYGADGDFGRETEEALKAFQEAKGLPVNGIYDAATKKALSAVESIDEKPAENEAVPEGPEWVLATEDVNVRSAPGTEARILGVLHRLNYVPYQGVKQEWGGRDWYLVEFEGENGWVSSRYSELTVG